MSLEVIANLARTMWLRIMRLYSVYAIFGLVTINAVPRQSFVIRAARTGVFPAQ
jgi:hypothetical protein